MYEVSRLKHVTQMELVDLLREVRDVSTEKDKNTTRERERERERKREREGEGGGGGGACRQADTK